MRGVNRMTPKEIADNIVKILDDRKAQDLIMLDISDLTVLADYFILCTGTSITHIRAMADEVEVKIREMGEPLLHSEGYEGGGWILLDFGCVVVHLFLQETREFYGLDKMWADGKSEEIASILTQRMG